ncbi:MAG: diguanylate cyclase domain-containing protein [Candidatus Limnocylindrales bacterium]
MRDHGLDATALLRSDARSVRAIAGPGVIIAGATTLALQPGPTPWPIRLAIVVAMLTSLAYGWLLIHRLRTLKAAEIAALGRQIAWEEQLRTLLERLPAAVYLDRFRRSDGTFLESVYISPRMADLTGYPVATQHAEPDLWLTLIHPDDRDRVVTGGKSYLIDGSIEQEYRIIQAGGAVIWIREEARIIESTDSETMLSHGFLVDITERKHLEDELKRLAFHDPLTGLANRALFGVRLEQALARSQRSRRYPAVLCLDLDEFKDVNDTYGHAAGDALLRTVGERLAAAVRPSDCVARLGGDEFVVLLEESDTVDIASFAAERLLRHLADPIDVEGHPVVVHASIGIAVADPQTASPDHLLRDADAAMYAAKAAGRRRWVLFGSAPELVAGALAHSV